MIPRSWLGKWTLCILLGAAGYFVLEQQLLNLSDGNDGWGVRAATSGLAGILWLFWYWGIFRETTEWDGASLAVSRVSLTHFLTASAVGMCFAALFVAAKFVFGQAYLSHWSMLGVAYVVGTALGAAAYEELIFRGFLFQLLRRALGIWFALFAVALFFTLSHYPFGTRSPLTLFLFSAALTAAYVMYRSLWVPVGLHFGWNCILTWTDGSRHGLPGNLISTINPSTQERLEAGVAGLALLTLLAIWLARQLRPPRIEK